MLMTMLNIIVGYVPDLEALNLEGNGLQNIERVNILSKKFSKLNILHIGDNKVSIVDI